MDEKIENVKLHIAPADIAEGKNTSGQFGKICNNCGGYGYTMALKGGRLPCHYCDSTGVAEISNRELQAENMAIKKDLDLLRQALIQTLEGHGVTIPTKLNGEAPNA